MADRPFDFHIAGIEDAIIATLKTPMDYVKEFATYGGELDSEQLRRALSELTPRLPLVLVAYGDGEDTESPATAAIHNTIRVFKHDCTFTVICCSGDARGEKTRRRSAAGCYKMIADVKAALDCVQFKKVDGGETIILNLEPLEPAGIDYLARLPDLTAYAVRYETYFKYAVDQRVTGPLVDELVFNVENTFEKSQDKNLPGVVLR